VTAEAVSSPFAHVRAELVLVCSDVEHQTACKLLVGGAGQPDTSLCERCEYRRYLQATGGRDYGNEQRIRWGLPPIPRPELR
jgi:hypothetical protein